jgi:RNA polymerase sigma factor (TIGR02999 family)
MGDITLLLKKMERGDESAANQLLDLVYEDLRRVAGGKMAQEAEGHTLQPTALVHEAWLRLGGDQQPNWQNRAHYFGAAAEAMRRILVESARRKKRIKHGGEFRRVEWTRFDAAVVEDSDAVLALHEALERLAKHDPIGAKLVELRFFAGLSNSEAAAALALAERTAKRTWAYARAWLHKELNVTQ